MVNLIQKGDVLNVACSDPAVPTSGSPVRFGNLTGVALTNEGEGGNAATETTVDFSENVYTLSVAAVDQNGNSAVALGDFIYYVDADTPKLSKKNTGYFFGVALQANAAGDGSAATIKVRHQDSPSSGTVGAGSITAAKLAADAVTTAKILDANVTAGKLAADAVETAKILNANVTTAKIADANVTEAKIVAPAATNGLNLVRTARAKYVFATDGGVVGLITPALTAVIPDNAIVFGALVNAITAPTSGGAATIAIGTTAGSAGNSIKVATAIATYTIDSVLPGTPVFTAGTAFKMTAAGSINITVAAVDLTAGVIEITVFYVVASA